MYHPISENDDDEYIELYNRSGSAVNLSGWKLQDGVSFTFASNTVIQANSYVVVAANRTNLLAKYSQLNATNCFGNFSGKLANGSERIALAMQDDIVSTTRARSSRISFISRSAKSPTLTAGAGANGAMAAAVRWR
jgi:hypothetical protein